MKRFSMIASLVAMASAPALASNDEAGRVEVGYLECDLVANDGTVLVSEQTFRCNFDPAQSEAPDEAYVAEIDKFGIDLSRTDNEKIAWAVFAPAEKYANGVLEGEYVGVSADVAAGIGIGARALVGGLKDSIALQPVSLSGQEGVGASLAFEEMTLTFVGDKI